MSHLQPRRAGLGQYTLADTLRTIDQPGPDVVADGAAWQFHQRSDFVEGEGLCVIHACRVSEAAEIDEM